LSPVVGSASVDSGSEADVGVEDVAPLVENVSKKMGACTPLTGEADAPRAPRRYTTMDPAAKPLGAGIDVNDDVGLGVDIDALDVGVGEDTGDTDGVCVCVGVGATGAKAMPRNSVFGEAAATYEKHNVHDEYAVPVAWLSS